MANLVGPEPMVGLPGAAAKAEVVQSPRPEAPAGESFGLNIFELPYFVIGINNEKGNATCQVTQTTSQPWLGPWTIQPVVAPLSQVRRPLDRKLCVPDFHPVCLLHNLICDKNNRRMTIEESRPGAACQSDTQQDSIITKLGKWRQKWRHHRRSWRLDGIKKCSANARFCETSH